MASFHSALICAALATAYWTCIGWAITSKSMAASLRLPLAPAMGWAVHSVVALPLLMLAGMSRTTVTAGLLVPLAVALCAPLFAMRRRRAVALRAPLTAMSRRRVVAVKAEGLHRVARPAAFGRLPPWAILGAALLATAIMAGILPDVSDAGVALSNPIFDHAKVALIDDMARLGLPAGNPFFYQTGAPERLFYYYLWHFSAAEWSILTGLSGWNTDAALTGFTAFASLMLMMGIANWLSSRPASCAWVLLLAATSSIRAPIHAVLGPDWATALTGTPSGFGTWLFQMTWAPQHLASACCTVIAIILLLRLAVRPALRLAILLALVVAAGLESSTWVGGVTFPLAAVAIGLFLLFRIRPGARRPFALWASAAALASIALAAPLLVDQALAAGARSEGLPIVLAPYPVLGEEIPGALRSFLDLPAYFLLFLVAELGAIYPLGLAMMKLLSNERDLSADRRLAIAVFALLCAVSLSVGALLASTAAVNNDLAWRGVLPAILVLTVAAAAGLARYLRTLPRAFTALALGAIAISVVGGVRFIHENIHPEAQTGSRAFADSARLWRAVRSHSDPDERVASDPLFLQDMTLWPINISWALLADRRSCYAGRELALPFAAVSRQRSEDIDRRFIRVFAGEAKPGDVAELAKRHRCTIAVVTKSDGAWGSDPFAASDLYRVVDSEREAWRIYRLVDP